MSTLPISASRWIGIDVSKAQLDVAVLETGEFWSAGNNAMGIAKTVERLKGMTPERVVVESTGGLERQIVRELLTNGVAVSLVNPQRVREFARSAGILAKTDRLDASMLARFGQAVKPIPTQLPSEEQQLLSALITRRRQLIDNRTAESNRLLSSHEAMRPGIEAHLTWLNEQIALLDTEIELSIQDHPDFQAKDQVLRSVPGIGPVTSAILIADLPELGQHDRKVIASLVGVAPFNNDSGRHRGKRRVKGGRSSIRTVLYMATISATRYNPIIKAFYEHLLKQGKLKKVAIVACMRKLLTILNAMVRDMEPWQAKTDITHP